MDTPPKGHPALILLLLHARCIGGTQTPLPQRALPRHAPLYITPATHAAAKPACRTPTEAARDLALHGLVLLQLLLHKVLPLEVLLLLRGEAAELLRMGGHAELRALLLPQHAWEAHHPGMPAATR